VVGDWSLNIRDRGVVSRLVNFKDQVSDAQVIALIRELQFRLSELRRERTELTEELEHQYDVESQEIIQHWDRAIEDLKADVEYEIDQQTDRIDLEKREVTLGLGRNRVVGELDREPELIIAEKWAWFDEEASSKTTDMEDELHDLKRQKASQIKRISKLIEDTELDMEYKLGQYGITLDQVKNQDRERQTDNLINVDVSDDNPEPPRESRSSISNELPTVGDSSAETNSTDTTDGAGEKQSRGFFLNSETGALADLSGSLDPTTLAILGILITLSATGIQLVKGNLYGCFQHTRTDQRPGRLQKQCSGDHAPANRH